MDKLTFIGLASVYNIPDELKSSFLDIAEIGERVDYFASLTQDLSFLLDEATPVSMEHYIAANMHGINEMLIDALLNISEGDYDCVRLDLVTNRDDVMTQYSYTFKRSDKGFSWTGYDVHDVMDDNHDLMDEEYLLNISSDTSSDFFTAKSYLPETLKLDEIDNLYFDLVRHVFTVGNLYGDMDTAPIDIHHVLKRLYFLSTDSCLTDVIMDSDKGSRYIYA